MVFVIEIMFLLKDYQKRHILCPTMLMINYYDLYWGYMQWRYDTILAIMNAIKQCKRETWKNFRWSLNFFSGISFAIA